MLTNPDDRCVCEWWCYDEAGYGRHRLAAADAGECLRRARLHAAGTPFCFGATAGAGDGGDAHDALARSLAGRIVSRPMNAHSGGESWRVRIAADPVRHGPDPRRMGRFYWNWEG